MNEQDLIKLSVELINKNVEKIFGSLKGYGTEKIKQHKAKTGKAFESYLESAIKKYSKVKTVIYGETPIFLYSTYTELNLKIYKDSSIIASNLDELLEIDNNIIVSGIAGSGKSTLLKYYFLNCIEGKKYIPLFIELRDINNINLNLMEFIHYSLEKLNFSLEKEYFETALKNGDLVFFLDGLDEVNYDKRDKVEKEIIDLSSKYNKNYFLISSRPNENFVGWNTFTEVEIQPLSKQQALNLIENINYYPVEIKQRFLEELNINLYTEFKSFASNPLLLNIMYISFSFNGNISSKINGFYEDAFEALFRRHDASKLGFKRKRYTNLDIREFKKVLSCFSLLSYFEGCYEYSSDNLIKYIDKSIKVTEMNITVDDFFLELYNSINILIKDGTKYVFSHRTFQEYFSAFYISLLPKSLKSDVIVKVFNERPQDKVLDFLYEIDKQSLEEILIIPYFEDIKEKIEIDKPDWCWRYTKLLFREIVLSKRSDEKVSFINNSNSAYHIMNLIIRLYFQSGWSFGSSKYNQLVNEIYASFASFSREGTSDSVNIKINDFVDKHLKHEILQLSKIKIDEFNRVNEIMGKLKVKYSNQERTITEILLSSKLL